MEQKHRLVGLAGTGKFTVTEVCADFQISRKKADQIGLLDIRWRRLERVNYVNIQTHTSLLQLNVLVLGFGCPGYTPHPGGWALCERNPPPPRTSTPLFLRCFIAAVMPRRKR